MSREEFAAFAKVVDAALGAVACYWDAINLPPGHMYRHACSMVRGYLRRYTTS